MSLSRDVREVARGWRWGRTPLVPASAEQHQLPAVSEVLATEWAQSPPAVAVRTVVQRLGLRPLLRSQVALRVTGREVLDDLRGPVVLVANHSSHLDAPLVLTTLPERWRRRTVVAAAADYFFDTWPRAAGSAVVFSTIPMERQGQSNRAAGGRAAELLREGWSVLVFPEGTRSADGWAGEFRRGAARLALAVGAPVVPVAIRGTYAAMPRGRSWPVPGRPPVRVRYGRPVHAVAGEDDATLTARLRGEVARLLDEDDTDWYASLRRAAEGETPSPAGPDAARWRRVWAATEPLAADQAEVRRSPWRPRR